MSFKSRLQLFLQNENTIYQLLLAGLSVASIALHYLCFYKSFDPLWLRVVNSSLCLIALGLSFQPVKIFYIISQYVVIISFLVINNYFLLCKNGFEHVYLLSAITVFITLTLFCRKRWEFVILCLLNIGATIAAYFFAESLFIPVTALVVLVPTFTIIAYVSFLLMKANKIKFEAALTNVVELNNILMINDESLREKRKKLNALINSLNEIIFEFDEQKICLNTWYRRTEETIFDLKQCVGRRLSEVMGAEKAAKFDNALDYVIQNREPVSIEIGSDFGSGRWFIGRLAPVYDRNGNYTGRISGSITDISEQKKYEDALRENEALLLESQAIAKTGNWWYDFKLKEIFWSESMYKILEIDGIPEDTYKYAYYMSLVHPNDRERTFKFFSEIYFTDIQQHEHKIITPKGNLRYFKILKGKLKLDSDGTPLRIYGISQDITDSKLSEKKVKISQAELLEAQVIAKIGNWKWDIILNKLNWSDEINNIFEIDQKPDNENHLVRLLLKHTHPNDRIILKQHLKDISNITNTSYEFRIVTKSGSTKYLSIIVGKILRRDDGAVRKIIGTIQDITDRKQAEIDYQRTENKYKLVLETIKVPAVTIGLDGTVIFCNKWMANLLGYEQEEIYKLNWLDDIISADVKEIINEWFLDNLIEPQFVNTVICRNGDQRLISWQNTVSYDENGKIKEITGIGEDITERERVTQQLISEKEQAEKASRFKSEFLSIMSHEIRTPMNAVIGTTNLLLSEDPKPDQLEYLNTLKFSGENLLAIINDILDYNKIEAGKLELNKIPYNIYHLVQKIKQSFYAKASEKDLEIELDIDAEIPAYLVGDQIRLGQILNNLLSNAVKFTHNGKISIRLILENTSESRASISFSVKDTGIGIAPESLAMIFDPFEQESQMSDNHYGGTGLGLAITKRLIELHQSVIAVKSKVGEGTEFSFAISFDIADLDQKKEHQLSPGVSAPANKDLQGMRILVVDDNKMNLLIASKFLKKWEAEVDEAISGQLAIEMTGKKSYDLIIMDLQMPVMDGFEATAIIRERNQAVPIIALTADAMPETCKKAYSASMCDYLTKPFVPGVLFEKIARHYLPTMNQSA